MNEKEKQVGLFDNPSYVLLMDKDVFADFQQADEGEFIVVNTDDIMYGTELMVVEIKLADPTQNYTIEDIMDITGCIAVHEEWTNAVITEEDYAIDIAGSFDWSGGGELFLSYMLTGLEKLKAIIKYTRTVFNEPMTIEDFTYTTTKGGVRLPLSENYNMLFGEKIYSFVYKEDEEPVWWPTILEDTGLFLAIIDQGLIDDDDDDEPPVLDDAWRRPTPDFPWYDDDYYAYGDYYDDDYKRIF